MKITACYFTFTNQKQWRLYIQELLTRNSNAVERAILAIYDLQTDDEKERMETRHLNKRGFDKIDSEYFSCLARDLKKGKHLTSSQLSYATYKMKRYWKQLMWIAKENIVRFKSNNEEHKNILINNESHPELILEVLENKLDNDEAWKNVKEEKEAVQLDFLDELLEGYNG